MSTWKRDARSCDAGSRTHRRFLHNASRDVTPLELEALENPENDRLRLLSAVLDFLRGIGAKHPLLLVLEDLHDADRATLDLLIYLARHLAGTPLLVVATYRDLEVDRAHQLAAALAELRRVKQFQCIHLGELSVEEVQRLLASTSQQAVPRTRPALEDRSRVRAPGLDIARQALLAKLPWRCARLRL
jgi:predicted ATPase